MIKSKRYAIELGGAVLLYGLLLVGANAIERAIQPEGTLRLAISLVPMLGAAATAWAVIRGLWRLDEMHRRIQFEAIALAFLGTAVITFGWGFGEDAGLPHLRASAVWPMMSTLWVLGIAVAQRRYR